MMQIETIILNTSLIEVTEKSIPGELIKTYTNSTTPVLCNEKIKESEGEKQREILTAGKRGKKFVPYFNFDLDSSKNNFNPVWLYKLIYLNYYVCGIMVFFY